MANRAAREAARQQRLAVAEHNRQVRAQIREQKQLEKELRQQYLESRQHEADEMNLELNDVVNELGEILNKTLEMDDKIAFDTLRIHDDFPPLTISEQARTPMAQPQPESFQGRSSAKKVGFFERLLYGENGKNDRVIEQARLDAETAETAYQTALNQWRHYEKLRKANIEKVTKEHEEARRNFELKKVQRNADIDELETSYFAGDAEAVVTYNVMVLERSCYPDDFPQEFRVAYVPESKELVIEYELPNAEIVPSDLEYRYVKSKDEIESKSRKQAEINAIYQDVVAAVCLRTVHEVFEADQGQHVEMVTLNGFVQTVDRTTGQDIRPYLISLRVTKERFLGIDLARIEKKACLRNLGAQLSSRPDQCVAVKPIVDFRMVDPRFVEGSDVLSDLEGRPNLMDLDPFAFENLVGNLFSAMGLDTRQTQTSRDGGVDVVAFDTRPVLGGKVVIQAKRYRNTVGVAAVRELYGTMINEGAIKGILVSTSGYGKSAFEFANDKPIELINGAGLLYLLENHAQVKAKIIMPED